MKCGEREMFEEVEREIEIETFVGEGQGEGVAFAKGAGRAATLGVGDVRGADVNAGVIDERVEAVTREVTEIICGTAGDFEERRAGQQRGFEIVLALTPPPSPRRGSES